MIALHLVESRGPVLLKMLTKYSLIKLVLVEMALTFNTHITSFTPFIVRFNELSDLSLQNMFTFEPVHEKTNNLGSDQVRHKPGCTVTEAG